MHQSAQPFSLVLSANTGVGMYLSLVLLLTWPILFCFLFALFNFKTTLIASVECALMRQWDIGAAAAAAAAVATQISLFFGFLCLIANCPNQVCVCVQFAAATYRAIIRVLLLAASFSHSAAAVLVLEDAAAVLIVAAAASRLHRLHLLFVCVRFYANYILICLFAFSANILFWFTAAFCLCPCLPVSSHLVVIYCLLLYTLVLTVFVCRASRLFLLFCSLHFSLLIFPTTRCNCSRDQTTRGLRTLTQQLTNNGRFFT